MELTREQMQEWHRARAEKEARENWPRAYLDQDQVPRWKSNNSVPPFDVLNFWHSLGFPFNYTKAVETRNAENAEFLAQYTRAQQNRTPEQREEERQMARAAHGPGVALMNAITGERFIT